MSSPVRMEMQIPAARVKPSRARPTHERGKSPINYTMKPTWIAALAQYIYPSMTFGYLGWWRIFTFTTVRSFLHRPSIARFMIDCRSTSCRRFWFTVQFQILSLESTTTILDRCIDQAISRFPHRITQNVSILWYFTLWNLFCFSCSLIWIWGRFIHFIYNIIGSGASAWM